MPSDAEDKEDCDLRGAFFFPALAFEEDFTHSSSGSGDEDDDNVLFFFLDLIIFRGGGFV